MAAIQMFLKICSYLKILGIRGGGGEAAGRSGVVGQVW